MSKQCISLIAAIGHDRVLGANNQLLWHLPEDFKHFKKMTLGKPVIMGRKTFSSIGKALPGRHNIVITRNRQYRAPECTCVHSLISALEQEPEVPELMIIGGADIYRQALPLAHRLYLTEVDVHVAGDTFFPDWDPTKWQEIDREAHPADEKNVYPYTFVTLVRRVF